MFNSKTELLDKIIALVWEYTTKQTGWCDSCYYRADLIKNIEKQFEEFNESHR